MANNLGYDYLRNSMDDQYERMRQEHYLRDALLSQQQASALSKMAAMQTQAAKPATPKEPPFNPVLLLGEDE